jgi:CheY-like chemotaxis protein
MTEPTLASILIVDDSAIVLRVMKGILSQAGYQVTCLDSGRDVVDVARQVRPDLIFVDFAMPDISGYGVCHALGNDPELDSIPIVVMNTRGDTVGDRFIRQLGIVDHITKPFAPEVLLTVAEHTLQKIHGDQPLNRRPPVSPSRPRSNGEPTPGEVRQRLAHLLADEIDIRADLAREIERALDLDPIRAAVHDLTSVEVSRHPLHGELSVVPVAEVLQVLSLQRQSGFLHVQRGDARISIAFENGIVRLTTGIRVREELLLGNILAHLGLIQTEELDLFLKNQPDRRQRLGAQAVRLGYLSVEDLHRALRRQSSELVYEILRWSSGEFWFERCDELPEEVLEFDFDLTMDELLMEGFRRVDEWGLIQTAIPSFDRIPCRATLAPQGLTDEEANVHAAVDGRRTVHEIIRTVGAPSFEVARVLYRLVSSRIVTMPRGSVTHPD